MAEQRSYTGNFNNRWKFNGKELDEETGLYYYGARFYNPSTSLWLSVDPLVEKTMDAYGYCYQNPINLIDPDGRMAWDPKVNEDKTVSYTEEKGDSAETLSKQYGITQTQAEKITGTKGNSEIKEGTEIKGENVKKVTGNEVLSLDLDSKLKDRGQKIINQFVFASDYSKSKGDCGFYPTDYFSGTEYRNVITAEGKIEGSPILLELPVYNPSTFDNTNTFFLDSSPFTVQQSTGRKFGANNTDNIWFHMNHPKTKKFSGRYKILVPRTDSDKVYNRLKSN